MKRMYFLFPSPTPPNEPHYHEYLLLGVILGLSAIYDIVLRSMHL
jgi:hypothetical protein